MAKSTRSSTKSRKRSSSSKPKYALVKSKTTGKPIGFATYTMKKAKDGHSYKAYKFIPKSKWPKTYKGVSKATIEKNQLAHLKKIRPGRKTRSRSATRSRSSSRPKARKVVKRAKSKSRSRSSSRSVRKYKPITKAQAELAFNKWYKSQYRKGRFASAKGMRNSMTYDLNHRSKIVKDERYAKNPHKFDYPGVDVGNKKRRPLTGAALTAHKKKLRAKSRSRSRSRSRSASKPKRKATKKKSMTKSKSTRSRSKPKRKASKKKSVSKSTRSRSKPKRKTTKKKGKSKSTKSKSKSTKSKSTRGKKGKRSRK